MMFNYKSARFTDLSEAEKKQFTEDGFIGDEGGDGYSARLVVSYYKDYLLPNNNGHNYEELLEADMYELPVGCVYGCKKQRFDGVSGSTSSVFYLIEPTICSATRYDNIVLFDNFVEAIHYYNEIKNFGDTLKSAKK